MLKAFRKIDIDVVLWVMLSLPYFWAGGVLTEAKAGSWGIAALDLFVFPVGIVDGFLSMMQAWR